MVKIIVMKGDARLATNQEQISAAALSPMMSSLSVISLLEQIKFDYVHVVTTGLHDRNALVQSYRAVIYVNWIPNDFLNSLAYAFSVGLLRVSARLMTSRLKAGIKIFPT